MSEAVPPIINYTARHSHENDQGTASADGAVQSAEITTNYVPRHGAVAEAAVPAEAGIEDGGLAGDETVVRRIAEIKDEIATAAGPRIGKALGLLQAAAENDSITILVHEISDEGPRTVVAVGRIKQLLDDVRGRNLSEDEGWDVRRQLNAVSYFAESYGRRLNAARQGRGATLAAVDTASATLSDVASQELPAGRDRFSSIGGGDMSPATQALLADNAGVIDQATHQLHANVQDLSQVRRLVDNSSLSMAPAGQLLQMQVNELQLAISRLTSGGGSVSQATELLENVRRTLSQINSMRDTLQQDNRQVRNSLQSVCDDVSAVVKRLIA